MHIRYKPRVNLGLLGITRDSIDYGDINGRRTLLSPTAVYVPPTPYVQPMQPPPVISVPISPPSSFYETPPVAIPDYIAPSIVAPGYFDQPPRTFDIPADQWQTFDPQFNLERPEQFVYSKDQILDMLARGASETFERTGETDSGLPIDVELEQKSRELDATKNYIINAEGEIIPVEPKATGGGLALLAAAIAGFFLLGG